MLISFINGQVPKKIVQRYWKAKKTKSQLLNEVLSLSKIFMKVCLNSKKTANDINYQCIVDYFKKYCSISKSRFFLIEKVKTINLYNGQYIPTFSNLKISSFIHHIWKKKNNKVNDPKEVYDNALNSSSNKEEVKFFTTSILNEINKKEDDEDYINYLLCINKKKNDNNSDSFCEIDNLISKITSFSHNLKIEANDVNDDEKLKKKKIDNYHFEEKTFQTTANSKPKIRLFLKDNNEIQKKTLMEHKPKFKKINDFIRQKIKKKTEKQKKFKLVQNALVSFLSTSLNTPNKTTLKKYQEHNKRTSYSSAKINKYPIRNLKTSSFEYFECYNSFFKNISNNISPFISDNYLPKVSLDKTSSKTVSSNKYCLSTKKSHKAPKRTNTTTSMHYYLKKSNEEQESYHLSKRLSSKENSFFCNDLLKKIPIYVIEK